MKLDAAKIYILLSNFQTFYKLYQNFLFTIYNCLKTNKLKQPKIFTKKSLKKVYTKFGNLSPVYIHLQHHFESLTQNKFLVMTKYKFPALFTARDKRRARLRVARLLIQKRVPAGIIAHVTFRPAKYLPGVYNMYYNCIAEINGFQMFWQKRPKLISYFVPEITSLDLIGA